MTTNAYLRLYALKEELGRSRDLEKINDAKAIKEALDELGAPWEAVQIITLTDRINTERRHA